jgi:hypothetical protein
MYYASFNHENVSRHKTEEEAAIQYDRLVLASGRQKNVPLNFQWARVHS